MTDLTMIISGEGSIHFMCSKCDYEDKVELQYGESVGELVDKILIRFLTPCNKCKGVGFK